MKDSWSKYFSKSELAHLLEIINRCHDCVDLDGLADLFYKLKKIAKFDAAVCSCAAQSRLPAFLDKAIRPVNYQCTENSMDIWQFERCYKIDVPVRVILSSLDLQDTIGKDGRFFDGRLNIVIPQLNGDRIVDGWIYGAHEKCCNRWILFVFACQNNHNEQKSEISIEFTVPHLFHAFKGLRYLCTAHRFYLTKREYEILNWVKMGKTTWEIAKILAISERCVNFHVDNLRKKFGAVNRTQAVAVALANGLIKI